MLTVRQQQYFLKYYYGYYSGAIDGIRGSKHKAGTKLFQGAHGLKADAIWGPKTDAKAIACTKNLQSLLNMAGANLKVDGIIGPLTVSAIKAAQRRYGLAVDGIAGPKTFGKLNAAGSSGSPYTDHFKRTEFKCGCRGKNCNGWPHEMDPRVINILEALRAYYGGRPITITSGVRCSAYNARVNGVSNSKHKTGRAADFYIPGICDTAAGRNAVVKKAYALGAAYSYCNTKSMGNAVHIDV